MRLTGLQVTNYRGFKHRTEVQVRPLTLLFGYNSSGKSALVRLLPLLAASVDGKTGEPLDLSSASLRGARFEELLCQLPPSRPELDLGLDFADDTGRRWAWRRTLRHLQERNRRLHIVERFESELGNESKITATWVPNERILPIYRVEAGTRPVREIQLTQRGLSLRGAAEEFPELNQVAEQEAALAGQVYWLDSMRRLPERLLPLPSSQERVGSSGVEAYGLLASDRLADGELVQAVSAWFERSTGYGLDVTILPVPRSDDRFSVELLPRHGPNLRVPILDTGEGMGQVLAVVVLAKLAKLGRLYPDPILALEHPELHLHPRAHEALAELLLETARDCAGAAIIVETHSPSLLLRVQIAVARGEISKDHVAIWWIRDSDDGSSVADRVELDEDGAPVGWPPDAFAEDSRLARELLEIRRSRLGTKA